MASIRPKTTSEKTRNWKKRRRKNRTKNGRFLSSKKSLLKEGQDWNSSEFPTNIMTTSGQDRWRNRKKCKFLYWSGFMFLELLVVLLCLRAVPLPDWWTHGIEKQLRIVNQNLLLLPASCMPTNEMSLNLKSRPRHFVLNSWEKVETLKLQKVFVRYISYRWHVAEVTLKTLLRN